MATPVPSGYGSEQIAAAGASTSTYATLTSTDGTHTKVIGSIVACNTHSTTAAKVRGGNMGSAGTPTLFFAHDIDLAPGETKVLQWGLVMNISQFMRVSASLTEVNFIVNWVEMTV